jgi:hypothetical protein
MNATLKEFIIAQGEQVIRLKKLPFAERWREVGNGFQMLAGIPLQHPTDPATFISAMAATCLMAFDPKMVDALLAQYAANEDDGRGAVSEESLKIMWATSLKLTAIFEKLVEKLRSELPPMERPQ